MRGSRFETNDLETQGSAAPFVHDAASGVAALTRRRFVAAGAAVAAASLTALSSTRAQVAAPPAPRPGGRLRVGMASQGANEILRPYLAGGEIGLARLRQIWETLFDLDAAGKIVPRLATEMSFGQNGREWKISLRSGVKWHDGSPFTADDVVYSLRWYLDPANGAGGRGLISYINPTNVSAIDPTTVRILLDHPIAVVQESLSSRLLPMFKAGEDPKTTRIGTGPFRVVSFLPGDRSLFARNREYWVPGRPYLDELEIISIADSQARVAALQSGQVDAIGQFDIALQPTLRPGFKVLNVPGGGFTCQTMACDTAPFDDMRVRQAIRLLANRPQMVSNALLGAGKIGNDLFNWFDDGYLELPQRTYDPDRAKFLLRQAGHTNLSLTLATADAAPGMLQSSVLLVDSAKAADVTIRLAVSPPTQYFSGAYGKNPFQCTTWGYRPMFSMFTESVLSTSATNETRWMRPAFDARFAQARATFDVARRNELLAELQRELHDEGGNLIWGFLGNVDATSPRVHGLVPSVVRWLGHYNFTDTYIV